RVFWLCLPMAAGLTRQERRLSQECSAWPIPSNRNLRCSFKRDCLGHRPNILQDTYFLSSSAHLLSCCPLALLISCDFDLVPANFHTAPPTRSLLARV